MWPTLEGVVRSFIVFKEQSMISSGKFLDWLALRRSFKHHQPSGFNFKVYVLGVSSQHLEGVCFLWKNNLEMCVMPFSISFGELGVRWFCYVEVQFSSVAQSCPTLCDPMDCSTPGLLVHHQLPELIQTHVHWVGDAIQPSHPLSSLSPYSFNLSQHQGFFKWVTSLHQVAKVLEFQLQH